MLMLWLREPRIEYTEAADMGEYHRPAPMVRIGVRIPEWLREAIEEDAMKHRRSISDMVRLTLEEKYTEQAKKDG